MPARKTPGKSARRPKKKTARRGNARRRGAGGGRGWRAALWLLAWPFLLLNRLTRRLRWWWKWPLRLGGHPAIAGALGFAVLALVYGLRAQRYDLGRIHAMPERTIILDRHGRELGRIHGEKRDVVPLKHVSEHFRRAILAREDERFRYHPGFDPIGMVRAFTMNLRGKREGASTITQQLASDVYGLKSGERRNQILRLVDRKFLEIAIAVRLELAYSKDELLEAYVNQINWGRQIRGIGEASRIYFEKHPAELDLSESALLAGIVRGPDAYNPFRSMDKARRERDTTLLRMVDAGAVTRAEADAAIALEIKVRPKARRGSSESYAMNAIRNDLDIILEREDIELGGLQITTTIDQRLQQKAEEALDAHLRSVEQRPGYRHPRRAQWKFDPAKPLEEPAYLQGGLVVIENRTGGALAVVGGRDVQQSRFNRAKYAKRPIGSLFKSFLYLAAFDRGMGPNTPVSDGPLQRGEIASAGNWNPQNSDGQFGGVFPASHGLIRSRNTMSVRVGNYAGMDLVQFVAKRAGFKEDIPRYPSSYLGTWNATPWEVASAYSIFPNDGSRYRPYLISEIQDRDGNILYRTRPISYMAARPGATRNVSGVLQQVVERGTAASLRRLGFSKPCGGKTGTTDNFEDAWFAGYTSQLSCAVWVGLDDPQRTVSGGYGSTLALPVWASIMKAADEMGYTAGQLHNRRKVMVDVCRLSGKHATTGCAADGNAEQLMLPADTAPRPLDLCPLHPARAIAIDPQTGLPVAPKARAVTSGVPRAAPAAPRATPVYEPRPPRAQPVR